MVDERTVLTRGDNNDVIATDVKRRWKKILGIVNIDVQRDRQLGE